MTDIILIYVRALDILVFHFSRPINQFIDPVKDKKCAMSFLLIYQHYIINVIPAMIIL